MSQVAELAGALQRELAPVLYEAATSFVMGLDRQAIAGELAELPNIGLLLQTMAGRRVAAGGRTIDFGEGNQFGDVSVGDVAFGSITKFALNVHIHQAVPLLSDVAALGGGTAPPHERLVGGNSNGAALAVPASAEARPRPGRVLVFDGETGNPIAAALRLELRLRGIESPERPPLEVHTPQSLRAELADADAVVLILSSASCAAATLRDLELPAAWARYGQAAPFWMVPLLDGIAPEAAEVALDIVGARLRDFRALALPADPAGHTGALATLAGLLLRSVAAPLLHLTTAAGSPIALTLFSYPASGAVPASNLALAWDALFPEPERPTRRPPSPEVWREQIAPALADLRLVVGGANASALSIHGHYHLSVGLAVGFRFRGVVGMALHVAAQPGGVWSSDGPGDEGELLRREDIPGALEAYDLSLEVSLSRDVRADASDYLESAALAVSRRVQLTSAPFLEGGEGVTAARTFVTSPAHARRLADQIANVILAHSKGTIHLFAALPRGLAVLLGARLNKARPVQCYELFDDPDTGWAYVPASTLR